MGISKGAFLGPDALVYSWLGSEDFKKLSISQKTMVSRAITWQKSSKARKS